MFGLQILLFVIAISQIAARPSLQLASNPINFITTDLAKPVNDLDPPLKYGKATVQLLSDTTMPDGVMRQGLIAAIRSVADSNPLDGAFSQFLANYMTTNHPPTPATATYVVLVSNGFGIYAIQAPTTTFFALVNGFRYVLVYQTKL